MVSWRTTSAAVLLLAIVPATARAEGAPPTDEADVDARLAWLDRVLDREGFATRVWWGSWVGFYSGAAVLEAVLTATSQPSSGQRVDSAVNTGKAAIAAVFVLVGPASAGRRADRARALPTATRADRVAKLRLAEASLAAIAVEERARRGWFPLIGGAVLNAGGAWIDWAAHKGNGALGWIGLTSGLALAQIQFHTQPTGAIRAWDAYRRAGAGARLGEPPPVLRWSIRPTAGGAAVQASF